MTRTGLAAASVVLALGCAPRLLDRTRIAGESGNAGIEVSEVPVRGFEVEVATRAERWYTGELLAVDERALWVEIDGVERRIPRGDVQRVIVAVRPSYGGAYAGWGAIGTASTLSHGFWLVLTAPAWLGTWIPIVAYESGAGSDQALADGLDALFQYARWPQGMPPERMELAAPVEIREGQETLAAPYPAF